MSTEVEHASGHIQTTVATPHTASTSGPKTSMFAKKAGFVIPKNKLSGSLVPVFRGTKRGDADLVKEEATTQVQRKTKWGPDLTLDTTVRKGRASAYQIRINQISQQLALGTLAMEDNQDTPSTSAFQHGKTADHRRINEESELELERREIIGEILKLNPTYKAPADYKPLLKEAKVPIPIKEYPGYNFIGLVFGPASDTQKRLEKETGAKIRVYGTKVDKGVKVEVTPTDGKEIDNAYEDLYVHVSADTFEKIDAAVALIELLVTPVSVNPVSSSTAPAKVSDNDVTISLGQSAPTSIAAPALTNPGMAQPFPGSLPPPQGQFPQYPQAWFSAAPTQVYPQSGIVTPANTSGPLMSNTVQVSSSPFNPSNTPSIFGPRPVIAPNFSPVLQNSPVVSSRPQLPHTLLPPYSQQPSPLGQTGGPRNTILQSQLSLTGLPHNARPIISTSPQSPLVNIPNNMISPLSGPSQSAGPAASQQSAAPTAIRPIQAMHQVPMRTPTQNIIPGPGPMLPQRPSSSDFTFQPHRSPNAASQVAWQSSQPAHHSLTPPIQPGQVPLAPQSPFSRPQLQNLNPPVQSFSRPQQINQPRAQIPPSFAGNPNVHPVPLGPPALPGHNAVGSAPVPHMQQRNFAPPHPISNPPGPFPPRPGSHMHIQQNHLHGATLPQRFPPPHPHFGNRPRNPFSGSSGGQQVYDPFSPTSVPLNPQMGSNSVKSHGESDPEYEDLMASVGVK